MPQIIPPFRLYRCGQNRIINPIKYQDNENNNLYYRICCSHHVYRMHRTSQLFAFTNEPMNDSIETLIKEFRKEKNVTYVNLPKSLIQIGMQMADDEDADKFLKQVDGIQILTFEEAPQKTKDKLFDHINNLETLGYEPMVKANEDGEKVRILLKGDEKVIHTLLIFAIDKEDCSLIKIDGHINPADVNDIVDTQIN